MHRPSKLAFMYGQSNQNNITTKKSIRAKMPPKPYDII